jgi:REP element-mobilizing transposase RayT
VNDSFNLPAPPNFRGIDPDLPVRIYHRHLPHWRQAGATYFVTFRLADSIPQEQMQSLKRWREIWKKQNPEPRSETQWKAFAKEITSRTERWLDEGFGECVLADSEIADLMQESLLKFQAERYFISCLTIMPNHVHCGMKPFDDFELEVVLRNMKGYVARKVNQRLGRKGILWEQESYDRILRDEEHLWQVVQYIGRNGEKAGLQPGQFRRWIHPEWIAAGWRFQ